MCNLNDKQELMENPTGWGEPTKGQRVFEARNNGC